MHICHAQQAIIFLRLFFANDVVILVIVYQRAPCVLYGARFLQLVFAFVKQGHRLLGAKPHMHALVRLVFRYAAADAANHIVAVDQGESADVYKRQTIR